MKPNPTTFIDWVFKIVRDRQFAHLPMILLSAVKRLDASKADEVKERIKVIEDNVLLETGISFPLFAEVWARSIDKPLGSGVYFTKCKRKKKRYLVQEIQITGYDLIAQPYIDLIGFVFEESGIDLEKLFAGKEGESE